MDSESSSLTPNRKAAPRSQKKNGRVFSHFLLALICFVLYLLTASRTPMPQSNKPVVQEIFNHQDVLASLPQRFYQLRRFDSTELLARSPAALQTYRYQSTLHGWPLNSVGLPQCAVDVGLLIFLQDNLLNLFEQGAPVPGIVTIWTKGLQRVNILRELVLGLPNLAVPIIVRNLEDVECPPATALLEDTPASTVTKALCFAEWLDENQLG